LREGRCPNRDPRRWQDAASYDVARRTGGHVGFGTGIQRCVGEPLARLEGEAVIAAVARRVRTLRLAGEPVLRINNTIRGLASLPLAATAA
jgi:cytochrome P450